MRKLLSALSSTLQGGLRGGLLFVALLITTTVFGKVYNNPISVTDGTAADWDALPAEYVASATHTEGCSWDGLKSVKVYSDEMYLNVLLEVNLEVVTDLAWTPFHIFLNADGSSKTGGYGEIFSTADIDVMLETTIYSDGWVHPYNPAVFKWWGEVGGSGWLWTDPNSESSSENCWGAVVCEGSYPAVGNAQMVDGDLGKVEIQLLKELIPTPWADEFTIGFEIEQSWTDVGHLPNAADAEDGSTVLAEKLRVQVCHDFVNPLHQDGLHYVVTSKVEPYTMAVVGADAGITTATIPEMIEADGITYAVTSIGEGAFADCTSLTSITIPNGVTSIGSEAFFGCSALREITLPASLKEVGASAFDGCPRIYEVTCLAPEPPIADESSFTNYDAYFHAYCDAQRYYSVDPMWKKFHNVECIVNENTVTNNVTITPSDCEATVVWLSNDAAAAYSLVISKNGTTFCTLRFNKYGQLTNIAFAPSRTHNSKQQSAETTETGYSFTITGLDAGTRYDYQFSVLNDSNESIDEYFGDFTTHSATAVDNISSATTNCQKILRDGQLLILRDGVEYTIMGKKF